VTVALPGDFGKPRPALVIQSDQFLEAASLTILPLSGTCVDSPLIRLTVEPSADNGLRKPSQIMVDKAMTVMRDRVGPAFGMVDEAMMMAVNRSLALFLGFA
jgi:mRNA interferase MazF